MLNYIKHLPLHSQTFRRDIDCTPRGPGLPRRPNVKIPIAGSLLRLKAPRHSPRRRTVQQSRLLPGTDLLNDRRLSRYGSEGVMANDHWGTLSGLYRSFAFWGPWLSGCKGELRLSISVVGRQPGHEFSDLSFFHPKAFELVLVQFLNDRYGHRDLERAGGSRETAYWHGPMDWQRHRHLPVFSASFNIYGRGSDHPGKTGEARINIGGSPPDHLFVFPITDQHFVQVYFKQHIYSKDELRRPLFDTRPIQALQDAIFSSITLELSPEAQASYDKVKAQYRNMQLSKEFAPLRWPTHLYGNGAEPQTDPAKPEGHASRLGSGG
jgi:hypothetical protein